MNKSVSIYEAPSVVVRTIVPPKVLCTSNQEYTSKRGDFDTDSD